MLDRWETAATALEHSANAKAATVSEGVDTQKQKASAAAEAVRGSLAPMFNRAKSAFVKAYEEFTKET